MVLVILSLIHSSFAVDFDVVTRKKNGRAKIESVSLPLKNPEYFETENFKVVIAQSEQVLAVADSDRDTRLKAATALYNLEKSRAFFVKIQAPQMAVLKQVTVRLDITDTYSSVAHYTPTKNGSPEATYNNAASIMAGDGWGYEVWFRPKKEIPIAEKLKELPENPLNPQIREVRRALYPMQFDLLYRSGLMALFNSDTEIFKSSALRQGMGVIVLEGAFQVLKLFNRILIPQKFYIDAALVPEIIFHEFTHLAVSDYMKPYTNTAVNEGLADYFAAAIGNNPKLAMKIKKFSTAAGKSGKKLKLFELAYENKVDGDFVLTLLWGMRDVLGADKTDALVFEARKYMRIESTMIQEGLFEAIQKACSTVCTNPRKDILRLQQYFHEQGL